MKKKFYYFYINKNHLLEKIVPFNCPVNTKVNENYIKLTNEQEAFYTENPTASLTEIWLCRQKDPLVEAKKRKCEEIDAYDVSEAVNGFYYNGQFMWLDRETRATLRNTIESLKVMERDGLNIWYGGTNITLDIQQAEHLLSALEVYATDCYNVTAQHKVEVNALETIGEVDDFDITADYPEQLHFGQE